MCFFNFFQADGDIRDIGVTVVYFFFFSSRRRHTRYWRDWSSVLFRSRRAIRFRLADTNLARLLDSMDICQSVLASFFLRAAAGQFDIEQPQQLVKLLVAMARNKLAL